MQSSQFRRLRASLALATQAKEIRAKHPAASREMWDQLAAMVQPGMTVGELESVLGTPSDGSYNPYLDRNRVTLIYRLSDRFRVRAVAKFRSPTDSLEQAVLLAPPQIQSPLPKFPNSLIRNSEIRNPEIPCGRRRAKKVSSGHCAAKRRRFLSRL